MRVSDSGWGIIFGEDTTPEVRQALRPLLDHRRTEAGDRYYEFSLDSSIKDAYTFLLRHGVAPGPADPRRMPYYLLIVGNPEIVPFSFQTELGVQYGVGRIFFETPSEYYQYARNVIASEKSTAFLNRINMFVPAHKGDKASQLHFTVACRLHGLLRDRFPAWNVAMLHHSEATKKAFINLLEDEERTPLVFVFSHGARYGVDSPLHESNQGGIVCEEFYIKNWHGRVDNFTKEVMFCKDDLLDLSRANVDILFLDACSSAGNTEFHEILIDQQGERKRLTPTERISPLAQSMLSSFDGGPSAVIGHVNDPGTCMYRWRGLWTEAQTYGVTLSRILEGHPVGFAIKAHTQKYVQILAMLHHASSNPPKERPDSGADREVHGLHRLAIYERNVVIIGDPAVRISSSS